jgi:hypothetical protein
LNRNSHIIYLPLSAFIGVNRRPSAVPKINHE